MKNIEIQRLVDEATHDEYEALRQAVTVRRQRELAAEIADLPAPTAGEIALALRSRVAAIQAYRQRCNTSLLHAHAVVEALRASADL